MCPKNLYNNKVYCLIMHNLLKLLFIMILFKYMGYNFILGYIVIKYNYMEVKNES